MLLLGIIFGLAGLLWLAILLRQGGLLVGSCLVLLTGSCLGHPFFHWSILTLDRLLWIVVMGIYLWQRWTRQQKPQPLSSPDLGFVVFLSVLGLSTMTHDWKFDGGQPASRLLFLYLMPAGLYAIARETRLTDIQIRRLFLGMTVFGAYLSLTACAEMLGLQSLIFPRYMTSVEHAEFLGRGRGPFLNPSANGIYITTAMAAWWVYARSIARHTWLWLAGGSAVFLLGAAATLTRCAWMGAFGACVLFAYQMLPPNRRLGLFLIGGTLGFLVVVASWQNLVAFKRDKNVSVADMTQSATLRPMLAHVALEMLWDHPLNGVGFGQYKKHDAPYIAARDMEMPLDRIRPYHQHNVVLALLAETGLLGTVPFLTVLYLWTRTAWQLWTSARLSADQRALGMVFLCGLIAYLSNGMFQDVALIPMVNLLLFWLAGLVMAPALEQQLVSATDIHRRLARRVQQELRRWIAWAAHPHFSTPPSSSRGR